MSNTGAISARSKPASPEPPSPVIPAVGRSSTPSGRDFRLDFFRGLALIFIFIDHIPGNAVADYTVRNFGFSDASEIFIFISGYAAGLVYMRATWREGIIFASARVLRRVWQLYVAHLFLFVIFVASRRSPGPPSVSTIRCMSRK
jgi:hypothetical protein